VAIETHNSAKAQSKSPGTKKNALSERFGIPAHFMFEQETPQIPIRSKHSIG
jgi:hypothetical protein